MTDDDVQVVRDVDALARAAAASIGSFRPLEAEHAGLELLDLETVSCLVRLRPEDVEALADVGDFLALNVDGVLAFPAFQFSSDDAPYVRPAIAEVIKLLGSLCQDRRTVLAWFLAPKDDLDGRRPADITNDALADEAMVMTAHRDIARLI